MKDTFIPRKKMSKKQRREQDLKQRGSWGEIKPVVRRIESKKAYCRKRAVDYLQD